MLAGADTVLEIDGTALRLRPSLRAALRLERRFGGFHGLLKAVGEGSVSALVALAVECGEPGYEVIILAPSPETWGARLERLAPQLVPLVLELADVDPDQGDKPRIERTASTRTITLGQALEELFGVATGVLGWSPADAWAATPAEIKVALDQHVRLIRAQNGVPEPSDPMNDTLDSAGLAELKAMEA